MANDLSYCKAMHGDVCDDSRTQSSQEKILKNIFPARIRW